MKPFSLPVTSGISGRSTPPLRDAPHLEGLHEYQKEGVLFLRARDRALLADDFGLGKSAQFLRAFPRRPRPRVLVVCPSSAALTWREQTERWRPDLRTTVGDPLRRPHQGEVLIVSQDSLPEPPKFKRELILEPMKDVFCVTDECHAFKGENSDRTIRFRKLEAQCGWVWGGSATPMLNNPKDLNGVLVSLGVFLRMFESRDEFVKLCGGSEKWVRVNGVRTMVGHEWGEISPEVRERLNAYMLRRLRRDVLELPGVHRVQIRVPAPPDLRAYLDQQKAIWDEFDQEHDQEDDLPPFGLLMEARKALARSRIEHAVEQAETMVEQLGQILVFSAHVEPVLAVAKRLKRCVHFTGATPRTQRDEAIRAFRSGRAKVLAMTIDTGGVSLNLQEAQGILFVDRDYTPAMNDQAEARSADRQGQRNVVVVVVLVSDHPIDVRLQEILDEKQRMIGQAVGL